MSATLRTCSVSKGISRVVTSPVSVSWARTSMPTWGLVWVKMSNIRAMIVRSSSMTAPDGSMSANGAVLLFRIALAKASMRRKQAWSSAEGPVIVRHDVPSGWVVRSTRRWSKARSLRSSTGSTTLIFMARDLRKVSIVTSARRRAR